jgi:hypothetical protein
LEILSKLPVGTKQEKLFDEKNDDEKSRDTVPLS